MSVDQCIERPLFGGAISSFFPVRFQDVSNIRQVPDNQEVFVDPARDESLIFELLEFKHDVADSGSANWFLRDLAAEQEAEGGVVIEQSNVVEAPGLSYRNIPSVATTAVGQMAVSKGRQGREAQNIVRVYLANLRLKGVGTDVLITAYEPLVINPLSESASAVGSGVAVPAAQSGLSPASEVFKLAVSSFKVWIGVLLTGFSALQRYGVRKFEALIAALVSVIVGCFFAEMSYAKPPAKEVLEGMFIPQLRGKGATGDAIALFGALVIPHNLFLHSGLVLSRKVPGSVRGINEACQFFLIESGVGLLVAGFINVVVIAIPAAVCSSTNLSHDDADRCTDLPFVLIPLLKFSSGSNKMGPHNNSKYIIVFSWVLGGAIIGVNIFYLASGFVGWLVDSKLHRIWNVLISIVVFPVLLLYEAGVVYLAYPKDSVEFLAPARMSPDAQNRMENGINSSQTGHCSIQTRSG